MTPPRPPLAAALTLALCCAPSALANDVIVVDTTGTFPTIQSAVAVASAGDVILVRPGSYTGDVFVNGVGLTIVGEGTCQLFGKLRVSGVPGHQERLIGGIDFRPLQPTLNSPVGAIDLSNCQGPVRIVDCNMVGQDSQVFPGGGPWGAEGGPGFMAQGCRDVALIDSSAFGGDGGLQFFGVGGPGGAGIRLINVAHATVMRTLTFGGDGGLSDVGGSGGNGLDLSGQSVLHLDYSVCSGGDGSHAEVSFPLGGGDGGHGLRAGPLTIWNFQSVFAGGNFGLGWNASPDGDPGLPVVTGRPLRPLNGHPSRLQLPLIVREGTPYVRRVSAVTGDRIRHEHAARPGFGFRVALRQPRLIQGPSFSRVALSPPIVSNDLFGSLIETRPGRMLRPGVDAVIEWQQAMAVNANGKERRTSMRPLIILRSGL